MKAHGRDAHATEKSQMILNPSAGILAAGLQHRPTPLRRRDDEIVESLRVPVRPHRTIDCEEDIAAPEPQASRAGLRALERSSQPDPAPDSWPESEDRTRPLNQRPLAPSTSRTRTAAPS